MFGVMPLFGFVSAGVRIGGVGDLLQPLPLAVALGLFIGKQAGIFGATWLVVRSGLAKIPTGASWHHVYGAALLCGIGFTMSLFIGGSAFPGRPDEVDAAKLGTLAGSLLSAIAGWVMLRFAGTGGAMPGEADEAGEIFGEDWEDANTGRI